MRFVIFFAIACVLVAEEKPAKLPADLQQAVDLAMSAPPEFTADALLWLVASGKIESRDAKREWVDIAFRVAARAQHAVRLVSIPGRVNDTRSGYLASALRLKLDALSLQSRAVEAMLALDKKAAREMFAQMLRTPFERLSCEATLVPDTAPYHEVSTRIVQDTFSGDERTKGRHAEFVVGLIDRISSHVELGPAAQTIAAMEWTPGQFEIVAGAFLSKLQSLSPDDRSFVSGVRNLDQAIGQLVFRARQNQAHPERIAEAYRSYLVANLAAPRCADNMGVRASAVAGDVDVFGDAIRGELAPLSASETRSKKIEAAAKLEHYWESESAKSVFEQCMKLRSGADGQTLSEAARSTREWKRELADFLGVLENWSVGDEKSEADYYHQRAIVYEALLELTPPGEQRNRVLNGYINFMVSSNLQQQSPVEWYWHAHSTLHRIRPTQPAEGRRILEAFAASGSLILTLEAMLDRLAPDYSMFPQ